VTAIVKYSAQRRAKANPMPSTMNTAAKRNAPAASLRISSGLRGSGVQARARRRRGQVMTSVERGPSSQSWTEAARSGRRSFSAPIPPAMSAAAFRNLNAAMSRRMA
jgi:hypothetical protein